MPLPNCIQNLGAYRNRQGLYDVRAIKVDFWRKPFALTIDKSNIQASLSVGGGVDIVKHYTFFKGTCPT